MFYSSIAGDTVVRMIRLWRASRELHAVYRHECADVRWRLLHARRYRRAERTAALRDYRLEREELLLGETAVQREPADASRSSKRVYIYYRQ